MVRWSSSVGAQPAPNESWFSPPYISIKIEGNNGWKIVKNVHTREFWNFKDKNGLHFKINEVNIKKVEMLDPHLEGEFRGNESSDKV